MHLDLQTYKQLRGMTSIYLEKICVNFSELLLIKCNENYFFHFKITQNKVKEPFFSKSALFVIMLYLEANKTLDKAYSNQLRSCNPSNRKKHITFFSTP